MLLKKILLLLFSIITVQFAAEQDSLLLVGDPAPTFALPTLEHDYVSLRDYCGEKLRKPWKNKTKHVVVISFFATWCKPCLKEIEYLEQLMADFSALPVRFFLIDVGEDREKVIKFVRNKNINIPVLLDRYQKTAEKYDALTLPRLVVIDKSGIVQKTAKGFKNEESFESDMIDLITRLLDSPP